VRLVAGIGFLLAAITPPASAQGAGFQFGYLWTDPPGVSYRLGWTSKLWGVVGAELHGVHINS
jgi:hypothetical protein